MIRLTSSVWSLLVGVVLFAGSLVVLTQVHESVNPSYEASACTPKALSAPFDTAVSIQGFGCEQGWSYLWATIGTGNHAIGVTELLRLSSETDSWTFANREVYCVPDDPSKPAKYLPQAIFEKACFSN